MKGKGFIYFSTTILQYGLGWYSIYFRNNDSKAKIIFIKIADWTVDNLKTASKDGIKISFFQLPSQFFGENCLSALVQGHAISVLVRAFHETGEEIYIKKAYECFNTFKLPIEDGGVVGRLDSIPVLEEFTNCPVHILNGHLYAFAGIIDLMRIKALSFIDREEIARYYNVFLEASIKLTGKMSMFFWSRYSAKKGLFANISSKYYHEAHIEQLRSLYLLTDREEFQEYAELWTSQLKSVTWRTLAMLLKIMGKLEYVMRQAHSRGV